MDSWKGTARLETNDPRGPQIHLLLSLEIIHTIVTDPPHARLVGLAGEPLAGEVVVRPGTDDAIDLISAEPRRGNVTVTAIEPREDGSTLIRLAAPASERVQLLRDILALSARTEDGRTVSLDLGVVLDHTDGVDISPRGIVTWRRSETRVLDEPGAEAARRGIQLGTEIPGFRFTVRAVEILDAPEGAFSAAVEPAEDGRSATIALFVRKVPDAPNVRGRVRIVIDGPEGRPPIEKVLRLYALFGEAPEAPTGPIELHPPRETPKEGTPKKGTPPKGPGKPRGGGR